MNLRSLPLEHRLAHQAVVMTMESDVNLEDAVGQLIDIELQSETDNTSISWPNDNTASNILVMAQSIERLLNEGVEEWKTGRWMIGPLTTDKDSMHVFYLKMAVAHGLISRRQAFSAIWSPTPCPSRVDFFFMKSNTLYDLAHWDLQFHEALSRSSNSQQQEVAV